MTLRTLLNSLVFSFLIACYHGCVLHAADGLSEFGLMRTSCGPRSAWVFASIQGTDLDEERVLRDFGFRPEGVPLLEIEEYLQSRNISCQTRQLSPSDLSDDVLPVIAHFVPSGVAKYGHFVVVVAVDDKGVTVIEPIIGSTRHLNWHFFSDRWSGYCVAPLPESLSRRICNSWEAVVSLFVLNVVLLTTLLFSNRR